jgi:O-antigen ligase
MEASSSPIPPAPTTRSQRARSSRGSDRDRIDQWCERGILGLLLLILVSGPLSFGGVSPPESLVLPTLTVGVLALWAVRVWFDESSRLLWAPVCWSVLAFMIYAGIRYRMVLDEHAVEYLARQEVILVLIYGCLFFAIVNNLSRQESTQVITIAVLCLGALISIYALYQFLSKSPWVLWTLQYPGYRGRGSGTYICPNHMAGLLEMILPLGLAYTLTGRFSATTKVFIGYASLMIFAGIAVSVSRGAWLATAFGLLVFFGLILRQHGQRLAALVLVLLLVGGSVFFAKKLAVLQRRVGVSSAEAKVDAVRLELWKPAWQMWQEHQPWGVGPAQFDQRFRIYRPDDIQMRPLYAHNDYLNTLADWGAVGMGLIGLTVVLLGVGVVQSWKYVQRSGDISTKRSNRSAFVLGASAGLIAILAHSVVDFNMHIPANAVMAVTLMALITGHMRFATERFWFKTGWFGKPLVTLVCLAGAFYLGRETWKRGTEYAWLSRARRSTTLVEKLTALKAAYAVEPQNFETTYEIGETLRLASWEGVGNYREQAAEAITWFERGTRLNPFDPYNFMGWGMCLHWLDHPDQAGAYFQKALDLDPRNYYIQGHLGWHYFQLGDLDQAEAWFKKAVYQAHWHPDPALKRYEAGYLYLRIIEEKRQEQRQNKRVARA